MLNRKISIEEVKKFLFEVKTSGIDLYKAILFGSAARDEMNESSDIDLLIVSDNFSNNVFENLRLYSKINIKYPDIETHPFSTQYFEESDPFIEEIKRTGIEII
jgi:predicted nucleotidyltransferase